MHITSDPGKLILERLQAILSERPLFTKLLLKYPPVNLNLPALLEVLESLKGEG
jgi:hypothetical protein